jgi:type I restriction enzyme M protein
MLINASNKFKPLKKSKGSKRKEVDEASRLEIVATLTAHQDNDYYAKVFAKEFFYFNKQAIMLTHMDEQGNSFATKLIESKTSENLTPTHLSNGERKLSQFMITIFDKDQHPSLAGYFEQDIKPFIAGMDYKEQPLVVTPSQGRYFFNASQEILIKETADNKEILGCGKIVVKSALKKAGKTRPERIKISVELTPDYQKDYEIIPFHKDKKPKTRLLSKHLWPNTSASPLNIWKISWV